MRYSAADEQKLMTELWDPALAEDPYKFVMFVYPWGKKGTPLEHHSGPRSWQREDLEEIAAHIQAQKGRMVFDELPQVWQKATASGRGPGKSAKVAWLNHWHMSCHIGATGIVTANNESQLRSKTFAEVGKWLTMAINGHWFEHNALRVTPRPWFKRLIEEQLQISTEYYYTQGTLWSEENPDAFAGAHNPLGMMVTMDEASGIPEAIFNVTKGFFTEPVLHRYWNIYSNPRRNTGAFFNCFEGPAAPYWRKRHLDARTVEGMDHKLFDDMIEEHGIDSYTVRVEVLGQFPRTGDRQFISNELVYQAQQRELIRDVGAPLIAGFDAARFGDDWNVFRLRQGPDARFPVHKWQGLDSVDNSDKVAGLLDRYQPDFCFVDYAHGAAVADTLKRKHYKIEAIQFGGGAIDKQWANKGTEMYADARVWLAGGCLPQHDPMLFTDLTGREYDYFGKAKDQQILEQKALFKARIGRSPDDGDAFVLTFARKVGRRDSTRSRSGGRGRQASGVDYPLFG